MATVLKARFLSARAWRDAVFIATFFCLSIALIAPFGIDITSALPQGDLGDPVQSAWFLSVVPALIGHGHGPFFTTLIDAPNGVNLAVNATMPLVGLLFAPLHDLLGPIGALNLLLRLAPGASASALYLVCRHWGAGRVPSFVAGLIYGFSPELLNNVSLAHANLSVLVLPPVLYSLALDIWRGRGRIALKGLTLGVLTAGQLYVSSEVLSDTALVGVFGALFVVLAERSALRARAANLFTAGAVAGVSFVVCALPLLAAMFAGTARLSQPVQRPAHLQSFRNDLSAFVLPRATQLLAPSAATNASARILRTVLHGGGSGEIGAYLGLPLVVLLIGFVLINRRNATLLALAATGIAALVASCGDTLVVGAHHTGVPLPEGLLAHIPLLDNTVPARFSIFVFLFAGAVTAYGLSAMSRAPHVGGRSLSRYGLIGLSVFALVALAPRLPRVRETRALEPGLLHALSAIPKGATVLSYPLPDPPFDQAMLWQAEDEMAFRLIGGYAYVHGKGHAQLYASLLEPVALEEYLAEAVVGRHRHYPPPPLGAPVSSDLCKFVQKNGVGAIVVQRNARLSSHIAAITTADFGPPSARSAGLIIWRTAATGHCTHAS